MKLQVRCTDCEEVEVFDDLGFFACGCGSTTYHEIGKLCDCGSGEVRHGEYDAQNIFLCYCCSYCREKKLSGYRPEILTGYSQEDVVEDIEPEPGVGQW